MTTEEAFIKVLQMRGIENAFGIISSAMMPVSDLFPKAGIKFRDCAHETNAGMFGPCGYAFGAICGAKMGQPDVPVRGFAGDGAFGISMNEMVSGGRDDWPPLTTVIFRNYHWGAEKRNTTLWYSDDFVGTELDRHVNYAAIAQACGVEGVQVKTMEELSEALDTAVKAQMNDGKTTFIEVLTNLELGEPFRRDAMKKPEIVAGIDKADMRPQQGI